MGTYLSELQSRTSQNLEVAREHVEPYVQGARDTASRRLSDVSTMLQSQAEGLGQQLEGQAEVLKTQLEATAEELRTFLQGRIDDLTEQFSPYAAQIREKIEDIVDKVKETATAQ